MGIPDAVFMQKCEWNYEVHLSVGQKTLSLLLTNWTFLGGIQNLHYANNGASDGSLLQH